VCGFPSRCDKALATFSAVNPNLCPVTQALVTPEKLAPAHMLESVN